MAVPYSNNFENTIPWSDVSLQVALTANVAQTFTVPGAATAKYTARFTYTATSNVFIARAAAPVVPGANTVGSQQYAEFRPGYDGSQRYVNGGDVIQFITPDATAYVGVHLMQLTG